MADTNFAEPLPRDTWRTVLAGAIVLLTIGGWVYSLLRPEYRAALGAQTTLWWVEQIVSLALMIAAAGVLFGRRAFVAPAFWLSAYSLVFDLMRWFFEFGEARIPVPVTVLLYALFMWRLRLVRQRRAAAAAVPPTT